LMSTALRIPLSIAAITRRSPARLHTLGSEVVYITMAGV
jgi:hypothetical protein